MRPASAALTPERSLAVFNVVRRASQPAEVSVTDSGSLMQLHSSKGPVHFDD
jgi:hypothetical protein